MNTIIFGFPRGDIHALAAALAHWLTIPLYRMHSPMIGDWYASDDLAATLSALKEGREVPASALRLSLEPNDPEPGYTSAALPGGDALLLYVTGAEGDLERIERRLSEAGLGAQRRR